MTPLQKAFLYANEANPEVFDGFLYAEAISCLNGDVSVGGLETGLGDRRFLVPALYLTLEDARIEFQDSIDMHRETRADDLDDPDPDFDDLVDDYEGEIFALRWDENDMLRFYLVDDDGTIHDDAPVRRCSAHVAMGSPSHNDLSAFDNDNQPTGQASMDNETAQDPRLPELIKALHELRHLGYAITAFTPEELDGADSRRVEDLMCERGWEAIDTLHADEDDELDKPEIPEIERTPTPGGFGMDRNH